ncbi:hypothetical protein [Flavobacterium muglaense]|uniref:Uncharacterized protein n=1 Tax=Flavobacterium muglaense TaxID=2764716 RepID=A0A923N3P4_9FLAO|nr:hypothetical protein [Flavobacterium muglaense]MBC5838529.1 hypothetical protein [Flavobacterium muglaense]MBC5845063.1 hypothetical protein [Flavobacterium muglaense]
MIQKHLILVDEQPQTSTLEKIKGILRRDGIDLIYKEINPVNYQKRDVNGDLDFDVENFKKAIIEIEFFRISGLILCDYNLIADVVSGYDIIKIIRELNYNSKKKIILYSAEIEGVISDVLTKEKDFEKQKDSLAKLISYNIEFIKRDGYDQEVIKHIKKEPEFDFETELIKWFHKRDHDVFNYLFPKYKGRSFGSIAIELESKNAVSVEFKKELIEQIISYLSALNDLQDA